jgi:hypothetical protein
LSLAAGLYEQAGQTERAVRVYRRYVEQFPRPLELALEARYKLARLYKSANDNKSYLSELRQIVDSDARAGGERTDRTRYLAAVSALALTEPLYERFVEIKLVKPFEKNLARKKAAMKEATDAFGKLAGYQAGEATAAAAFYIAEIYYQFGKALTESDRPDNLSAAEREQYELALEEQAYPFEEKAIKLHEKNLELLSVGVYNAWIDKSIEAGAADAGSLCEGRGEPRLHRQHRAIPVRAGHETIVAGGIGPQGCSAGAIGHGYSASAI